MTRFYRYSCCLLLLLTLWQVSPCQNTAKPTQKPLNQPGEDADFQRYLNSGRISVVAFYADWCPSCRSWAPMLDTINTHFPDMQVLFMDIGEWDTPVTEKYGIESVPYFKIYDGAGRFIVEGSAAKAWLRQQIGNRFQARARGTYRFNGDPGALKINEAAGSVSTRPRKGTASARSAPASIPSVREKIDSSGPLPSVDKVLARYLEALGGPNGGANFRTRTAKGKVEISKMGRGSFVTHAKTPNKIAITIEIPEVGVIRQGFNGAAGWIQNPRSGPRSATETELAMLKKEADFNNFSSLKARYPTMKLLGILKIGYREAYVVEAKPQSGPAERLYFSKDNGLLIRRDAVSVTGGVMNVMEIYLDDWTEVDGLKMPFTVTQLLPRMSLVFSFGEVKHDVELNDAVFNRPDTKAVSLSNRR